MTSTDLIHRTELPRRLAIVGGGYLGDRVRRHLPAVRLGGHAVRVQSAIFDREDDDIAAVAEKILVDDGIEIVTGANVTEVRDGDDRGDGAVHGRRP